MNHGNALISTVFALAVLFLLLGLLAWRGREAHRKNKNPFTKRYLRPPGESLRLDLEKLDDKTMDLLLWLMSSVGLLGVSVYVFLTSSPVGGGVFIAVTVAAMICLALRLEKHAARRGNYYLGFLGERAVGEELNQLLAKGWSVFHDVPLHDNPSAKPFNVDHVVVGTGGLFAIETKARRKRADAGGHEVTFNGQRLIFPWGEEDKGIKNARERAEYLAGWLSKQLAASIIATPVLVLPGWMVHRKGASELRVVSSGELLGVFKGEESNRRMDSPTVQAIKALLDQKCRDVEA